MSPFKYRIRLCFWTLDFFNFFFFGSRSSCACIRFLCLRRRVKWDLNSLSLSSEAIVMTTKPRKTEWQINGEIFIKELCFVFPFQAMQYPVIIWFCNRYRNFIILPVLLNIIVETCKASVFWSWLESMPLTTVLNVHKYPWSHLTRSLGHRMWTVAFGLWNWYWIFTKIMQHKRTYWKTANLKEVG